MTEGALDKLKIGDIPLKYIRSGVLICSEELEDWNIKKDKGYKVHWDNAEGPFIYSSKWLAVDRIDLWTLDKKLKLFTWIQD